MQRRTVFTLGAVGAAGLAASRLTGISGSTAEAAQRFEVTRTEAEWRAMLTDAEYRILREEGTERAYSSDLLKEDRAGIYSCKGCGLDLYSSETKFHSGTGWPSFYAAIDGATGTKSDHKLFSVRTEEHCRRCGSHMGHIFDDGPEPTGKRHCIDGLALTFRPSSA